MEVAGVADTNIIKLFVYKIALNLPDEQVI